MKRQQVHIDLQRDPSPSLRIEEQGLVTNGDLGPWMKDGNMLVACCTDGIKPVVFKLERLDEAR